MGSPTKVDMEAEDVDASATDERLDMADTLEDILFIFEPEDEGKTSEVGLFQGVTFTMKNRVPTSTLYRLLD